MKFLVFSILTCFLFQSGYAQNDSTDVEQEQTDALEILQAVSLTLLQEAYLFPRSEYRDQMVSLGDFQGHWTEAAHVGENPPLTIIDLDQYNDSIPSSPEMTTIESWHVQWPADQIQVNYVKSSFLNDDHTGVYTIFEFANMYEEPTIDAAMTLEISSGDDSIVQSLRPGSEIRKGTYIYDDDDSMIYIFLPKEPYRCILLAQKEVLGCASASLIENGQIADGHPYRFFIRGDAEKQIPFSLLAPHRQPITQEFKSPRA